MTITVTGLSAGAVVAADVMTLGVPTTWAGNLLSYNTSSGETDATGWSALTNCTVDRVTSDSWEGWYSLRLTSVAAGNTRANSTLSVPVTVGTVYTGMTYVKPTVTTDVILEIRWYDASDAFLSGSAVTWSAVPAGAWTRLTAIGTAPATATAARLAVRPQASGAGQTWLFDYNGLTLAPLIAGNLLSYGTQSFEVDAAGWSAVSGCTIARTTASQVQGAASMAITTTGGAATVKTVAAVPVTPRLAYKATAYLYHGATATNVDVDVLFTWYDALGVEITTGTYRWTTSPAAGWYTPMGADVAPDTAVSLRVAFRILSPGTGTYYLDEAAVTRGGLGIIADVIPGAYGAAISLQGLTTGGHTHYGVWRVRDDGALTAIRGETGDMTAVPITGDVAVATDYEAPLGVPLQYSVRVYTGSDYLRAASRSVVIPEPPVTDVVVKDPVQPVRSSTLTVDTVPDWTRAARQGVHQISGRTTPIVITDVRTSRTGTMTVVTETRDDITRLWWLLESGNTLLIQWPSTWGEQDVYVQVGDVQETHILRWAKYQDRTWTLPLVEVDRPIGGLVGSATRTWADVEAESSDWLDVLTTHSAWLGVYSGEAG
ncbi:hypothetical protein AB0N28_03730 [Streptomyces sp. NPDC051130]|uniref:hypothetical protein n=1 Tax=Streptomyces sp. NPDC051130 TaxID=3157223 RepID=UPI003421C839